MSHLPGPRANFLTPAEVAAELRVSKRFVMDELARKNLRGSLIARQWRISPADLETYVRSRMNVAPVRGR